MAALTRIDRWGVTHVAAGVVDAGGLLETRGEYDRVRPIASVTKLLTAYTVLVLAERGVVDLDEPAGPPGSTLRHLLAHASGYGFEADAEALGAPGTRRIYSNRGYDELAAHLQRRTGTTVAELLAREVARPLGMTSTELAGSAARDARSTVEDLSAFAVELLRPTLLPPAAVTRMRTVAFPGLDGVLPGVGRFDPLDWGLGPELNFGRPGHWAGEALSTEAFGHFGASGTFLWVDPRARLACVCLTDREFGPWALEAWPQLTHAVLEEYAMSLTRGAPSHWGR